MDIADADAAEQVAFLFNVFFGMVAFDFHAIAVIDDFA